MYGKPATDSNFVHLCKLSSFRQTINLLHIQTIGGSALTCNRSSCCLSRQLKTYLPPFQHLPWSLISPCLKKHSGETLTSYPPELRSFALTLQLHSSRAYNYVRETFGNCLPHPQTLSGWYKSVNGKPGFNDQVFAALASKAQGSVSGRLLCSFMMDEIAIHKQLDYDTATDKFVGYVDMGVELDDMSGLPLAHEALVFMIVSLTESWKLPVAYFLIAGLHGSERANLVKLCLEKLYTVAVDIVSLTFDGSSANIAMANILGASLTMNDMRPMF